MNRTLVVAIAVVLGALIVLYSAAFTVREDNQAIVLQFGEPIRVAQEPGLHWKIPFLQNVVYFDERLLLMDIQHQEVTMQDQKRMLVDAYIVYRIVDPLKFLILVQSVQNWERRLDPITGNILRGLLAQMQFGAMLTPQRIDFNRRVTEAVRSEALRFGVEVADIRVTRADVPDANAEAIFRRMQSERQREAAQERAEGSEISQRIRAEADRDRTVLLADATRQSSVTRGAGDAEATRIYAEAFNRDRQFYAFWRSLQAYQRALGDGSSTMVLSPDGDFFRYFNNMRGAMEAPAGIRVPGLPTPPRVQPPAPPGGAAPAPALPTPAPAPAPGPRSDAAPPTTPTTPTTQ